MDDLNDPAWMISRGRTGFRHAFFISHVSEDNREVLNLRNAIAEFSRDRGYELGCFLDLDDWRFGIKSTEVIRHSLIESEHMVVWVTRDYLRAARGWAWLELAFGELIQLRNDIDSIREVRPVYPFVYPVFRNVQLADIQRSALLSYWETQVWPPRGRGAIVQRIAQVLVDQYWILHRMP